MKIFLILLAIIYALFPYDLLPDLFLGWGRLDDAAVLYLLWRFVLSPGRPLWERQGHGQAQDRAHGRESGPGGRGEGSAPSGPEDPYAVLGVDRDATDEEIRKAYRALANRYHPDKVEHLGEEFRELAEKRFRKISEAYHALTGG